METKERVEAVKAKIKELMDLIDIERDDALVVMCKVGEQCPVGLCGKKERIISTYVCSVLGSRELIEAHNNLNSYMAEKASDIQEAEPVENTPEP